jgi:hypothetical protein
VGGTVVYAGARYATLDGVDPLSLSSGWQAGWLALPDGWVIAPNSQQSRSVIAMYPFGADCVFVSDGSGYYTALRGSSAGQQAYGNYWYGSYGSSSLLTSWRGAALRSDVYGRILIVALACEAGFYGFNGSCSPCTNARPVGAEYVTAGAPAGTNLCGWACSVGFYRVDGGCAACNNSKPDHSI